MNRIAAALAVTMLLGAAGDPGQPTEPSGFRNDNYRSPVPATLHGAVVLTTEEARAKWQDHAAAFIDVLPQPPKPAGLPAATIWRPKPRQDIPGSVWLPDTGYGALAPVMADYFDRGLRQATGNDRDRAVVFYCLANCWMSWNAAKRAIAMGYRHVAWYPGGTDGWIAAGQPLETRTPEPRPQASE
ncbi:MAG TPA: PQQ-dependent catabolism-associated CXXCW motif protein [Acetobacteraceae bacterium]|nr:PQQ-dependent catabolism-associated CXXCW motif protein [Acetobacteraceae bacterium]